MRAILIFIILLGCVRLSAAVPFVDTPKIAVINPSADTIKLLAAVQHPDNGKFKAIAIQTADIYKISLAISQAIPDLSLPTHDDNLQRITSFIQLDSLRSAVIEEQARQNRARKLILQSEQIKLAEVLKINNLDSLKQQLKLAASDTVKALIYTRIALKYLNYDTVANPDKQVHYQNAAINYTLLAIRAYSSYNDSTALRDAYSTLARVYYSQKLYTQAKWFILQANTLSRAKNDTPNIISSLLTLASIKSDIKDYTLAMGDLDEALLLSITNRSPKTELEVLKSYALFYNLLQNYPKEALMLKKRDSLLDSIRKNDEALLAKATAKQKKTDLLNKKKLLAANTRKPSKNNSQAKTASF